MDLVFLYVTYYSLPSALLITDETRASWPPWATFDQWLKLPTGTERRAHRSVERLRAHLVALDRLRENYGGLDQWVDTICHGCAPDYAWRRLQAALRSIDGNGRWAAYKTGEILAYLGWPLTPTDAGHDFSTGPRKGLALVFPEAAMEGSAPGVVAILDQMTEGLRAQISDALGFNVPVEQLETVLCDWHSLAEGRYYVGHDIDQQLEQLVSAPGLSAEMLKRSMAARAEAFDERWLGEANGWAGVRKPLRTLWRDARRLEWWT